MHGRQHTVAPYMILSYVRLGDGATWWGLYDKPVCPAVWMGGCNRPGSSHAATGMRPPRVPVSTIKLHELFGARQDPWSRRCDAAGPIAMRPVVSWHCSPCRMRCGILSAGGGLESMRCCMHDMMYIYGPCHPAGVASCAGVATVKLVTAAGNL